MFLGISSLILASVIDTVFVGWLGTSELAVISFAFPFMMVVMSLTMGLGVGVTSIMSRTLGGGDREKSLTIGTHTLILATVVSITVGIAGFASASSLFAIQGAESDVLAMTVAYAQIWLLGLPFFCHPDDGWHDASSARRRAFASDHHGGWLGAAGRAGSHLDIRGG